MGDEEETRPIAQGNYIAQATEGSTAVVGVYLHTSSSPVDQAVIAAAQQKLIELPLEGLPPPGPLPSGSRMPFARNPLFVGRETDLRYIASILKEQGEAVVAVTALGGMGKTQL